ncbi:MAG: N-acetyltransferase [Acidobacteria bacterium]|nr:N-acetyltransferase [Acidobacteriota bacterium]
MIAETISLDEGSAVEEDATRPVAIRKARMQDISAMARLINSYANNGIMLPRNELDLAEGVRDFTVAEIDGQLAGCAALHFYTPIAGEVRSLAVAPEHKGAGVGRLLVEALEREARECDLATLFAFTYVPGFFVKLGFDQVDRGVLPLKAWKDCLSCPKFQNCDEIAMLKKLRQVELKPAPALLGPFVQLPVVRG